MRSLVSILVIFFFCETLMGQSTDIDSLKKATNSSFSHYDSIKNKKFDVIDDIDSVNKKINQELYNAENFRVDTRKLDSLLTQNKSIARLDSIKSKLQSKIDSLKSLNLSTTSYTRKLDSLDQINPLKKIEQVESKVAGVQNTVNDKVNKPLGEVNEKLDLLSKESEGYGTLPSPLKGNAKIPGIPDIKTDLPDLPGHEINNPLGKVDTDLNINIDVKEKLGSATRSEKLGSLEGISKSTENLSAYSEDIKNIGTGNVGDVEQIDKDLVSKVSNDQFDAAQRELGAGSQQIESLKSLKGKEEFKKQTLVKARQIVEQQIALNGSKIGETVNKVSAHQRKAGTIFSKVKGLPKRPIKSKKPPFIERFVPGATVQIQKTDIWHVDLNPSVRYRVKSIFSAGLGWNERIIFNKHLSLLKENRVYGFRSFCEVSILKGLLARTDVERLNAFVPINKINHDIGERKNVWIYMAGIKKEFSFVPGVMGNVQFMYNVYDPKKTSPYFNRFNVRFGFEFPLRKKSQKK